MNKLGFKLIALAAVMVGFGAAPSAHATWTFNSSASGTYTYSGSAAGDPTVKLSGVYATNGGTFNVNSPGTNYGIAGFAAGATWTSNALLSYSGGLGMDSDGSAQPNHAIDNGPKTTTTSCGWNCTTTTKTAIGNTEAALLSFGSSVVLSGIDIGYENGDADVSLFRYTKALAVGQTAPTLVSSGATLSEMTTAGWELVENRDLYLTNPDVNPVNATGKGSSWWLISAYNTSYGSGANVEQGNDYFKLYAVSGTKCTSTVPGVCGPGTGGGGQAPEPASLALVAVGLVGAVGIRRRRGSAAAAAA